MPSKAWNFKYQGEVKDHLEIGDDLEGIFFQKEEPK
jgi:hypothetical protein